MPNHKPDLTTIPDMAAAMADGRLAGFRKQVAPVASGVAAAPLIAGTESFTNHALAVWHRGPQKADPRDVACYVVSDAVVAGSGQIWVDGRIVTSPEIMPPYVAQALGISGGGADALHHCASLPIRTLDAPCLVALGAVTEAYGHFLIEMLFRILVARMAWPAEPRMPYKILLHAETPDWLLRILADELGINAEDIELFHPWHERIALPQAILPTRVFQDHTIHPFANTLIEDLLDRLNLPIRFDLPERMFVARGVYYTPEGSPRVCSNEQELIDLATDHFGFTALSPQNLKWRDQIMQFQNAQIIVGLTGSGLHNALFCRPGSRVGSVGFMNFVQSEIGALRAQRNGYLTNDVDCSGAYSVDKESFKAFLQAMCN